MFQLINRVQHIFTAMSFQILINILYIVFTNTQCCELVIVEYGKNGGMTECASAVQGADCWIDWEGISMGQNTS
jgi:hypothetical protein